MSKSPTHPPSVPNQGLHILQNVKKTHQKADSGFQSREASTHESVINSSIDVQTSPDRQKLPPLQNSPTNPSDSYTLQNLSSLPLPPISVGNDDIIGTKQINRPTRASVVSQPNDIKEEVSNELDNVCCSFVILPMTVILFLTIEGK